MYKNRFPRDWMQVILKSILILICLTLLDSQLFSQPLAKGHDKFLGNTIRFSIPDNFTNYWNQVTVEDNGKWGVAEIGHDIYDWGGLDQAYNFAINNNLPYKHHTLVWGQQQPWWIQYLDSASQAEEVEEWIQLVAQRCPETDFVDVVNEPLLFHGAQPSYKNALGGDGDTGWDWVVWSFKKARQYFPDSTKLILNEYNILNSYYYTNQIIDIINLLKDNELIDGIGVQCHYFELRGAQASTIKTNLDNLAATGLPIYISEFDVDLADDNAQLQEYQRLFPVLWEHLGVKGITLWGYIENRIWKVNGYLIRADGTERPALQWLRTYLAETGVKESPGLIPTDYTLYQNYPNPFNPTTTIRYSLRESSKVKVTIYNTLGVKVRTLMDSYQNNGEHSIVWDARDDQNIMVSSGIYFYRMETPDFSMQKKMILVR